MVAPNVAEKASFGSDGGWVSRLRQKLPKVISELLEFGYCFYDLIKLCQAIKKHQPDAIYERYNLYLPSGIWAKQLFNLPLILEVNSPLYQERMNYGALPLVCLQNGLNIMPGAMPITCFLSLRYLQAIFEQRVSLTTKSLSFTMELISAFFRLYAIMNAMIASKINLSLVLSVSVANGTN
ncbi:hypothetical protein AS132_00110 [Photobacterium sanguinicancri]|nr:hypothetical protein [Photobacterium sanguinicancri]KXI24433.1 hypothetical protein AS132_00110 [Photobacterium sanguinicancri]